MVNNKYRDYFKIDDGYFPQVSEASIAVSPDSWKQTYPHHTFIEMLQTMERLLGRKEMRSLWIDGAYGTGKSQCAYTLKKILEVPEEELRVYWDKYDPLKNNIDLLEKLIGHKRQGILTAMRFSSGDIFSPKDLFLALQDTLKQALRNAGLYEGENTLKEGAIAWIEESAQKNFFNDLLKKPEWSALFSQSSADEVLAKLRKGGDVKDLMGNIFRLANKEGITAMNIDVDKLIIWLTDVIDRNNIKIVFIWDEFSDYFRNNKESLSVFQKLVDLVSHKPFFFVVVTHQTGQLFTNPNDTTWKKVRDRFIPVQITLPDNIAFDLIGQAFTEKTSAKREWDKLADDLNARLYTSRQKVMTSAKIKDDDVMKKIIPLHPMAALILKNIAVAFQSNQRSMFDFIKSSDTVGVKAFQWFIENTGPLDDHPLLTVDMLWDFFYEKRKDSLTPDIRLILDTFAHQKDLTIKEQTVLKAILTMQAIDQRLSGNIELFKATDQHLKYVFEGISSGLETGYKGIAKSLVNKGVLILKPLGKGQATYAVAVLAGDQSKIDDNKKELRSDLTTSKLVMEGDLASVLSLSPALKLRFETDPGTGIITPVTSDDFTRNINILRDKPAGCKFHTVIAFAKDESEGYLLREKIKAATLEKDYEHIVIIDALSTPLEVEAFEQYIEHQAMSMYHSSSNKATSREYANKAQQILAQDWKNRIYNGPFIVYSALNREGEKVGNANGVESILQTIVTSRFKHAFAFDLANGLTESQLKLTQAQASAGCGIKQATSGVVKGLEQRILQNVWNLDKYWENPKTSSLPISIIKAEVEKRIATEFARDGAGQIAIGEIYDFLEEEYGFPLCNLSAFLTGFLLKEYGREPYRYMDESGAHESMAPEKLAEMIGNYINHLGKPGKAARAAKQAYIVKITADEMAFYGLTEKAWTLKPNSCSSVSQAANAVCKKMRDKELPAWCLKELDEPELYDVVQKYIDLVQKDKSPEAQKILIEIGRMASQRPNLGENLANFITRDNCNNGMLEFLRTFEDGKILELAKLIGAEGNVLEDIRRLFDVKHSALWDKQSGEDEISKLLTEYGIVKETNYILNSSAHSLQRAFKEWRERLQFFGISQEALRSKYSWLAGLFNLLLKIYKQEDVLLDQLNDFLAGLTTYGDEIRELLNNDGRIFAEVYAPYLEGMGDGDIAGVKSKLPHGLFTMPNSVCNAKVKEEAAEFRKNQLKTQLFNLWKEKTGTKSPHDWSDRFRTPILCCIPEAEYGKAKKAFEIINKNWGQDIEIKDSIEYFQTTKIFESLSDESKRNALFERGIIDGYRSLLPSPDAVREALDNLPIDAYDWHDHPTVKCRVKQLAEAEYNAGGSDRAVEKIDGLNNAQLKEYLKRMVKESMIFGIEILENGGKQ